MIDDVRNAGKARRAVLQPRSTAMTGNAGPNVRDQTGTDDVDDAVGTSVVVAKLREGRSGLV